MKLTTVLILCTAIIGLTNACSLIPGYQFPTLDDYIKKSAAIFVATVSSVQGQDVINDPTVIFSDVKFIKGCGNKVAIVDGYTNSAMCGIAAPEIGKRVVVFACKNENQYVFGQDKKMRQRATKYMPFKKRVYWNLNSLGPFPPLYYADQHADIVQEIKDKVKEEFGCTNCCKSLTDCQEHVAVIDLPMIPEPAPPLSDAAN